VTNLRAGIDTPEPDHALIAKLSLPFDDQEQAIAVLRAIAAASIALWGAWVTTRGERWLAD
jgi:deferrochelatase/peroxidase EfeB